MMKKNNVEQVLQEQLAQLPKEISPERDLWPGIERAINQQPQEMPTGSIVSFKTNMPYKAPLAWAASIVFAVLVAWVSFAPQDIGQSIPNLAVMMEQGFEQQKKTMLVSLGQPDLNKLTAKIKEQFTQLSSAQAAIKKALMDDPNNADLLNLLQWTQQQELDLLEKLYRPQWQSI